MAAFAFAGRTKLPHVPHTARVPRVGKPWATACVRGVYERDLIQQRSLNTYVHKGWVNLDPCFRFSRLLLKRVKIVSALMIA